jgi:ribonuclease D
MNLYYLQLSQTVLRDAFKASKSILAKDYQFSIKPYLPSTESELNNLRNYKGNDRDQVLGSIDELSSAQRYLFGTLLQWRLHFAQMIDEKPLNIMHAKNLLFLTQMVDPTADKILAKYLSHLPKNIQPQAKVLNNLLYGQTIDELKNVECHNCLRAGHGPAWACPFPKNKENYKIWFNRPENQASKQAQNERRRKNWEDKTGGKVSVSRTQTH